MNYTKRFSLLIIALALAASFFLPLLGGIEPSYAAVAPWDCVVTLKVGELSKQYRLSDNLNGISDDSLTSRAAYCSSRLKKQRIEQLVAQGYTYEQAVYYCLPNIHLLIAELKHTVDAPPVNAEVSFSKGKFTYTRHKNGVHLDGEAACKLIADALAPLCTVEIPLLSIDVELTEEFLRANTVKRGGFVTQYASSSGRAANIALALSAFDGLRVASGEYISFNAIVGPRTAERGYKDAKIIVDGNYVQGVGGGVCQASTTLYNALLLADVAVVKRSAHSLLASYVAPSFDAMVNSGSSDLVFYNNTPYDLYIYAKAANHSATVAIYGAPNDYVIKRVSETLSFTPAPVKLITDSEGKYADKVKYQTDSLVIANGSPAVVSRAKLLYYDKSGALVKTLPLSRDQYKSSPCVVVRGSMPPPLAEGE